MANRKLLAVLWMALLSASIIGILSAGCKQNRPAPSKDKIAAQAELEYIGNDACRPCHEAEFASHHLSRHDTTMHPALCSALGKLTPPTGIVPLGGFSVNRDADSLVVKRDTGGQGGVLSRKLDLVLGSGKLGMTYISLFNNDSLMETRMSYFPAYKMWDITPGQEARASTDTPFGRVQSNTPARLCLSCHASSIPEKGIAVQSNQIGVGCEACHGPGRAHVAAMRSGKSSDVHINRLSTLTPTQLNEVCGRCHRNSRDVDLTTIEAEQTHRFQPYALIRSQCRTKGNEPLSCIYCHNPHTDASKDSEKYDQVCLACHSAHTGNAQPGTLKAAETVKGKLCPINKTQGCVGCHMRPRIAFPETSVTATMADHLIVPPHKQGVTGNSARSQETTH